jgi:hypothetical protein
MIARTGPREAGSFNNHYIKWNRLRNVIGSSLRCCAGKQTYTGVPLVFMHACKMAYSPTRWRSLMEQRDWKQGVRRATDQTNVLFSATRLILLNW